MLGYTGARHLRSSHPHLYTTAPDFSKRSPKIGKEERNPTSSFEEITCRSSEWASFHAKIESNSGTQLTSRHREFRGRMIHEYLLEPSARPRMARPVSAGALPAAHAVSRPPAVASAAGPSEVDVLQAAVQAGAGRAPPRPMSAPAPASTGRPRAPLEKKPDPRTLPVIFGVPQFPGSTMAAARVFASSAAKAADRSPYTNWERHAKWGRGSQTRI